MQAPTAARCPPSTYPLPLRLPARHSHPPPPPTFPTPQPRRSSSRRWTCMATPSISTSREVRLGAGLGGRAPQLAGRGGMLLRAGLLAEERGGRGGPVGTGFAGAHRGAMPPVHLPSASTSPSPPLPPTPTPHLSHPAGAAAQQQHALDLHGDPKYFNKQGGRLGGRLGGEAGGGPGAAAGWAWGHAAACWLAGGGEGW